MTYFSDLNALIPLVRILYSKNLNAVIIPNHDTDELKVGVTSEEPIISIDIKAESTKTFFDVNPAISLAENSNGHEYKPALKEWKGELY